MPARTMRTPDASEASSSVSTGSTSFFGSSSGLPPGGTSATGGSQLSPTKNTPISSDPITNSGSAIAASVPSEMTWSAGRPALMAATAPRNRDSGIMKNAVTSARITEFLSGLDISGQTGACFSPCAMPTAESPRLPWASPEIQSAYSAPAGLSRCRRWLSAATCWGVPFRPSTTLAASPGSTTVPRKMTTDATRMARSAPAMRRPRKASTGDVSRTRPPRSATAVMPGGRLRLPRCGRRPGSLEPRVHEAHVAEGAGPAGRHPLHLRREPVHPVRRHPVDVAALVVLDLLDLVPVVLPLGLVDLADRLEQQRVERGVVPVRLVVRGVLGQRLEVEELHPRDRPLRLGEPHLQVEQRGVVVGVRRLLLEVDGDAGGLGLLGEQCRGLHEARDDLRRLQLDREVLLPG